MQHTLKEGGGGGGFGEGVTIQAKQLQLCFKSDPAPQGLAMSPLLVHSLQNEGQKKAGS